MTQLTGDLRTTSRFRQTLVRVMSMQLVTLLLLAILQLSYDR
jgi:hypothetical protein